MTVDELITFLQIVAAPIVFGAVIDQVVDPKHRDGVALYIFGFKNRPFRTFERDLIQALLSPFLTDEGALSGDRVILGSSLITFFIAILLQFSNTMDPILIFGFSFLGGFYIDVFIANVFFAILISIFSFPMDFLSLRITKFLFLDNKIVFPMTLIMIPIDIILSLAMYVLIYFTVMTLWTTDPGGYFTGPGFFQFFIVGAVMSALISVLISTLQCLVLALSLLMRSLMLIADSSGHIAVRSRIHDFPFTWISFIIGILLWILSII